MAAWNTYRAFLETLHDRERELLRDRTRTLEEDLLAARSEDARVRLVHAFMADAKTSLTK